MYEFASVSRAEKMSKFSSEQSAVYMVRSLRFIMTAFPCFLRNLLERQEILCLTEHGAIFSSINFLRRA